MPAPASVHCAILAAAGVCALLTGCAIRYDSAGVTRVGIGLWGLGDPPGVDWNLDWPRADVPELPKSPPLELPPAPARRPEAPFAQFDAPETARDRAIDDAPGCALCCDPSLPSPRQPADADAGGVGIVYRQTFD